ncbi:Peptidase C48, SUMO/Sentrin/Ubl1 family-containing protein [Strongyloides ratti]|uniref:Peptidase C48, SUMO/Sentrin/Ubl1 family-containing protein n=1 Tax=Strongyloides ratti TaxID=34506 RepID=A0A090L6B4_STRRB|nr:Peptidase C48, SUMO/Sentrin/Ubl1 family-containing protein [Strongyloides ratti]CEF63653.2 Peptidase C48, SUMO/Sentrin/Ubl1 family-containing protein [Strongyloides ratti]
MLISIKTKLTDNVLQGIHHNGRQLFCKRKIINKYTVIYRNLEVAVIFRRNDKETWKNCDSSHVVLKAVKIFANRGEILLASDVILLDDKIKVCAMLNRLGSVFCIYFDKNDISKIKFLDNSEKQGAAIVLTICSKDKCKEILLCQTPETRMCCGDSLNCLILTIPIVNSDSESIQKIDQKLLTFCQIDNNNSPAILFNRITFSKFKECILPFKLKPVTYVSNKSTKTQYIVIMRNDYSIEESDFKLKEFLTTRNQSFSNLNSTFSTQLRSINAETNEIYDLNGKGFGSLFYKQWLHNDIIDAYLNKWRKRMNTIVSNSLNNNGIRVKIFNTLLYTRLTRNVEFNLPEFNNLPAFHHLRSNARRISRENIYHSSTFCLSIFDFDVIVIPIHLKNHWIAGIIYQPKNCLVRSKENKNENIKSAFKGNRYFCPIVLKEYVKSCYYNLLKEESFENSWFLDTSKLKVIELKNPYQQMNGHDCGLFMLEFIRQIMIKPLSLKSMVYGKPMKEALPGFNVNMGREYLKSFVYSKVSVEKWIVLYEMEEFFLTQHCNKKFRVMRSRSLGAKVVAKKVYIQRKYS